MELNLEPCFVDDFDADDELPLDIFEKRDRNYEKIVRYLSAKNRALSQIIYQNEMKKLKPKVSIPDGRKANGDWVFLTINPKADYPYEAFFSVVKHSLECKMFDSVEYSFEQRGTVEGDYHGVHCHALLHRKCSPSHLIRELKRKFKDVVGDVENKHQLNIQLIPDTECESVRQYIGGNKQTSEKSLKSLNDKLFREKYRLQNLYVMGASCSAPIHEEEKLI